MARNEFKPPSDFNAEGADGGGSTSIWKWVGIGCGVVVIIGGIALALGAWKTVSCCSDVFDSAKQTARATKFARTIAADLSAGKVEAVHQKMSDQLGRDLSVDALRQKITTYDSFLQASTGRISDLDVERKGVDKPTRWDMDVEFSPPTGKQKLVVAMGLISRGQKKKQHFVIDSMQFDKRRRDLRDEAPAQEVVDFHRNLRRGQVEQAYQAMSQQFSKQQDIKAFEAFIDDQQPVFRSGEVTVVSVEYSGSKARVVASLGSEDASQAKVQYALVRRKGPLGVWTFQSITPTYSAAAPGGEQPDAGGADAKPAADDVKQPDAGRPDANSAEANQ